MIQIKLLLSNSIVKRFISYYSFTIINSIIGFITISFLTRSIEPEDYGYIGIYNSFIFFMPSLLSFGALGLQGINIIDLEKDEYIYFRNCLLSFISLSFLIYLFIGFVLFIIFPSYFPLLLFILFDSIFLVLIIIHLTELVQRKKAVLWGVLSSLSSILVLTSTVILVGYFKLGWEGRLLSIVIVDFVLVILRFSKFSSIFSEFKFVIDTKQIRCYLNYGFPILISLGATWLIINSDRYVLLHFYSMKEVGLYTASFGIASILATLNSVVVRVFVPDIYEVLKEKKGYQKIKRISISYSFIVMVGAIILSVLAFNLLEFFFGEKYASTAPIIAIMCFSQAFFGIYCIKGLILEYYKLNRLKTTLLWVSAIISITVSLVLIRPFGIYAPALGTMFGFMILAFLTHYYTSKYITEK